LNSTADHVGSLPLWGAQDPDDNYFDEVRKLQQFGKDKEQKKKLLAAFTAENTQLTKGEAQGNAKDKDDDHRRLQFRGTQENKKVQFDDKFSRKFMAAPVQ
jgi:hypothetical protein